MLKRLEILGLIVLIICLVMINRNLRKQVIAETVEVKETGNIIVLDAGHGGSDPGKIGVNGALEKDINLQIVMRVRNLLEKNNISVVLTRDTDAIEFSGEDTGSKKADMKKRIEIINETNPFLAVSIHQNSFTDSSVSGAQVFYYSGSKAGEKYGKIMQSALHTLDENNKREAKSNDTYYLLRKTNVPTVIVECGFLSNPQEAKKLMTEEYQETISKAIVDGIESCFGN